MIMEENKPKVWYAVQHVSSHCGHRTVLLWNRVNRRAEESPFGEMHLFQSRKEAANECEMLLRLEGWSIVPVERPDGSLRIVESISERLDDLRERVAKLEHQRIQETNTGTVWAVRLDAKYGKETRYLECLRMQSSLALNAFCLSSEATAYDYQKKLESSGWNQAWYISVVEIQLSEKPR